MKHLPTVRVSATFVAEPVEPALRFWLANLGLDADVEFAPYNQVFQELLGPAPAGPDRRAHVVLVRPEDWLTGQQAHAVSQTTAAPAPTPPSSHSRYRMPNGVEVAELNRSETEHLYREIFRNRAYLRHGIAIEDGAVVVDCGANIGMFSLFTHLHARNVRIVAVEPGVRTASVLRANAALHGMALTLEEAGVSDKDGEASFTFYDNFSVVSSFDAGDKEDETFLRAAIRATLEAEGAHNAGGGAVETLTDYIVAERMKQTQMMRPVHRLSTILRKHGLTRVDLLKLDIEKVEVQALESLDDDQWPMIQQIAMEIHDRGDAIRTAVALLESRGFRVTLEEERDLKNTGLWNLFAIRPEYTAAVAARQAARDADVLRNARDLAAAVQQAASHAPLVAVVLCPPSAYASAGSGAQALYATVTAALREATSGLTNVVVADAYDAPDRYACANYYDWRADALGHMPYSEDGYGVVATVAGRAMHSRLASPFKVVAVDCDNTLWAGVVGEDGPAGVRFEPAQERLHAKLIDLQRSGVLLAMSSKNEAADVWSVFDNRPDFGLRREHFVTTRLNWSPKSENLRSIAEELNLGLDSVAFLDDNPVECAEVSAHASAVTTLQWPADATRAQRFIEHLWAFDTRAVTTEDRKRTEMYRQEARRRQLRDSSMSLEAFLASLDLQVTIGPVGPADIPRAAQLTQRTNQFNFTTIRRTEDDIRRLIADGADVRMLHVKDRFGDYGVVGLAIARKDVKASTLVVDSFMMSCRVLGKGVEHRLLASLGALAVESGLHSLSMSYTPTSRNRPAWLFASAVFGADASHATDARTFVRPAREVASLTFTPSAGAEPVVDDEAGAGNAEARAFRPDYQRIASDLNSAAAIAEAVHPVSTSAEGRAPYVPPTNELEETLTRIWSELLHLDRVGVHDNFFAIGGDSIVGIQVLSRAGQAGVTIEMKDLFEHETIAAIARAVEARQGSTAGVAATSGDAAAPGTAARVAAIASRLGRADVEQVYRLAPIQQLFLVALEAGQQVGLDQWRSRIDGSVDLPAFRAAWNHVVAAHDATRTAFVSDAEGGAIQAVLGTGQLPWHEEDLSTMDATTQADRVLAFMAHDREKRFDPRHPPLMRVAMFRLGPDHFEMVWTFHHLLIDGWSCPLMFAAVGEAYDAIVDGRVPPADGSSYARYVNWLERHPASASEPFWRRYLAGFTTPTSLPRSPGAAGDVLERVLRLSAADTAAVNETARRWRVSVNTLLQLAWALVLSRQTGRTDVVFGVVFAGRPSDLADVERIIGPFVNNLPVRVGVDAERTLEASAKALQAEQFDLLPHQATPLPDVQRWSNVGAGVRLFESLLVLQSYVTAAGLTQLGSRLRVTLVSAPIRTNYPLTIVAVPGSELTIRLIANPGTVSATHLEHLTSDLFEAVRAVAAGTESMAVALDRLSTPVAAPATRSPRMRSSHPVPPKPGIETTLTGIWERAFGLHDIGVNETFTDLGGQSLLMLQIHAEIERALGRSVSIVALFQNPTIRSLAMHLDGGGVDRPRTDDVRSRAARQAEALARQTGRRRS